MTKAAIGSEETSKVVGWVGSLAHTPLAEVIRRIVLEERSGDLQITTPSAIKTIYFDRGFVVFASSNLKSDRLGESMIEAGRISRREFFLASMLMQRGNRKFGQALVQAGIVSEEELGRLVAAQVNRIVLSLFSVNQGMYSFDERPCIIPLELMVSLSVYRIFIEGIRRMTKKNLILAGLPSLDTKVKIVDAPPFTLHIDKLRPAERAVARSIGNGASLHEITKTIGGDEGKVLRACYGLYAAGIVEEATPDARKRPRRVQMETGTFVLSEIRRKVEKKRDEPTQSATPAKSEGSPQTSEKGPPFPSTTPPTHDSMHEPESRVEEDSLPTVGERDLQPGAEPEAPGQEIPNSTSSWFQLAWHVSESFLLAVMASIFKLIRRLLGRISQSPEESQEEQRPSQPVPPSALGPHAPPYQEPAFILEERPVEPFEQPESDRTLSEPEGPEAQSENLVAESVGVPSWSLLNDPNDALEPSTDSLEKGMPRKQRIESVGVPSWSMKDDPRDALKQSPAFDGEVPQPRPGIETPEWSLTDGTSDIEEPLPPTAGSRPPALEADSADQILASTDHDLFVEQELEEDHEPSMLSPIALDEIVLEQESTEIDTEIERAMFSNLPGSIEELISASETENRDDPTEGSLEVMELEDSAALSAPEPVSSLDDESAPQASPPPLQDGNGEEKEISSKAEDPMEAVRLKQRGGEARLFRDVKLHFNFRDYGGAIPLLEQLVQISPGTALYRGMLARALSGHPPTSDSAEKHFIEALRLSPQDPELHYWLGLYYKKFGLKARATNEFRTTLRIDSSHEGARKQLRGEGKQGVALGGVFKKLFG